MLPFIERNVVPNKLVMSNILQVVLVLTYVALTNAAVVSIWIPVDTTNTRSGILYVDIYPYISIELTHNFCIVVF